MHLLNTLWQKKGNLIILLLAIIAIMPALPILRLGTYGVFYNIDPEMALIGNALSLIKDGMVHYGDHPGTPSIVMISLSYFPIRIYTKFVEHINFITWSFDNLKVLFLYTRIFYLAIFSIGIYIFLSAINRFSKNIFVPIFSWLLLFTFGFTPRLIGTVLTESLTFLLISIWLFIFTFYIKRPTKGKGVLMSFVAGLAIANKYNSFPILLTTLICSLFLGKRNLMNKFKSLILSGGIGLFGFVVGTWEIRSSYLPLLKQVMKVLFQSGSAHGNGESAFFDAGLYKNAIMIVSSAEKTPFLVFVGVSLIIFFIFVLGKKLKIKFDQPIYYIFAATFFSTLFIAKYPVPYYQFPNFILVTFIASYLVSKLPKSFVLLSCLLIMLIPIRNISAYNSYLKSAMDNSIYLEEYILTHKTNKATLWDYGMSEDFMRIWIRGWSQGVYSKELKEKRPDLLELKSDYKTVYLDFENSKDVFDVCWDKLYIRESRATVFLDLYKTKKFKSVVIGNTGIWEVMSSHCITKP